MSSLHTLKWTADRHGNWSRVPAILERAGNGYVEAIAAPIPTNPNLTPRSVSDVIEMNNRKRLMAEMENEQ